MSRVTTVVLRIVDSIIWPIVYLLAYFRNASIALTCDLTRYTLNRVHFLQPSDGSLMFTVGPDFGRLSTSLYVILCPFLSGQIRQSTILIPDFHIRPSRFSRPLDRMLLTVPVISDTFGIVTLLLLLTARQLIARESGLSPTLYALHV